MCKLQQPGDLYPLAVSAGTMATRSRDGDPGQNVRRRRGKIGGKMGNMRRKGGRMEKELIQTRGGEHREKLALRWAATTGSCIRIRMQ